MCYFYNDDCGECKVLLGDDDLPLQCSGDCYDCSTYQDTNDN